jgi:septal ring factor EnvC (AmiA/AmiB activator)
MLCLIERLPAFEHLESEISNLKSQAEQISRQLRAWADSLQNSPIKGHRYLNDKARKMQNARRDREEFLQELEKVQGKD